MSIFRVAVAALAIGVTGMTASAPALAEAQTNISQTAAYETSGDFIRKSKRLKGSWDIVERDGRTFIVFSDDFRAANGPDLKIFLSPKSVSEATGKTAVDGALNIGELKKTRGAQEYEVPADIDLSQYGSVLVHCEAFSVLWGGGNL